MLWGYCAIHIIQVQEVERLPALSNLLQTIKNKTAEKTYHAVCKEYDNVCKIWSDEEIEELREIQ